MIELLETKVLKKLEALQLKSKRSFLGSRQGQHRSLRKGHGLEFDDHRAYAPGDDFRYIDWAVFARTDKIYLKQFREEQDINISIVVDASQSMNHSKKKFQYSKSLGLALSYTALNNGDNISFNFLGLNNNIPRTRGLKSFNRLAKLVSDSNVAESFNWQFAIRKAMQSKRTPGVCYIISDFLTELDPVFAALDYLRAKGFEINLIKVQDSKEASLSEIGSFSVTDCETGEVTELSLNSESKEEYQKIYKKHYELLDLYCAKSNINFVSVLTNEEISDVLFHKFLNQGLIG